jgi:2'-deoxymugineic-acid 2'-dioxygenase / mugineic-acid 3-dioxygenase
VFFPPAAWFIDIRASMENMLHLRYTTSHAVAALPDHYVFSPDQLPAATSADRTASLPIVDMSQGHDEVCRAILDAGKEFGFFVVSVLSLHTPDFPRTSILPRYICASSGYIKLILQVVNHGVPKRVMQDMEDVCEEFFRLPAEDKAHLYSEERHKPNRIFTGATYETGGEKYWRDCLRLALPYPVGDGTKDWPDKPQGIR